MIQQQYKGVSKHPFLVFIYQVIFNLFCAALQNIAGLCTTEVKESVVNTIFILVTSNCAILDTCDALVFDLSHQILSSRIAIVAGYGTIFLRALQYDSLVCVKTDTL